MPVLQKNTRIEMEVDVTGGKAKLKDIVRHMPQAEEGDEVTIKMSSYLGLMAALSATKREDSPLSCVITACRIKGSTADTSVLFDLEFDIDVIEEGWNTVKLIPTSFSLAKPVVCVGETTTDKGIFGIEGTNHVVMFNAKGRYVAKCSVEAPFANNRRNSTSLSLPQACSNRIEFFVRGEKEQQIECRPNLSATHSTTSSGTTLKGSFPPTSSITLHWTDAVETIEAPDKEEEQRADPIVTCEQQTSYSVGEGVLLMEGVFNFKFVHASRSTFNILVDDRTRVLQVEAEGLKKWRVASEAGRSRVGSGPDGRKKLVVVDLNYAVDSSYTLSISLEMDMGGTSVRDMHLPVMWCDEVAREKAMFVVEARTNVEVDEVDSSGVAPIDINELPDALRHRVRNPLLAFKSLYPRSAAISINVTKHEDTEVLVTVIEQALFEATISADGKALHRIRLNVRNTQRQYMRATLPEGFEIWSVVVGGNPLKPAQDEKGKIMIPLQKSNSTNQSVFGLELVFLADTPALRNNGRFTVTLAQVDIPINLLFVTLHLPKNFNYPKFQGNVEEVKSFSSHFGFASNNNNINIPSQVFATNCLQQQQMFMPQSQSIMPERAMKRMESLDHINESLQVSGFLSAPKKSKRHAVKGVTPVTVDLPTVGRAVHFQKLLVTEEDHHVIVNYKKISDSRCVVL